MYGLFVVLWMTCTQMLRAAEGSMKNCHALAWCIITFVNFICGRGQITTSYATPKRVPGVPMGSALELRSPQK